DENSVFLARGALPSPTRKRFQQLLSDYGKRDVSFQDVMQRSFDVMWNNPLAFFLNILGWHDFPLEDDDPTNSNGTPREEAEDTKAFLAVLASFSELNGKKIFVMAPARFISALSRETAPANVFPLPVDLNDGGWDTLDMHPNKEGHRELAAKRGERLRRTEKGGQCRGGDPCPSRCNSRSTSPWNSRGDGSGRVRRYNFSDPSESLGVRPRWAWPCRPRRGAAP